MYDAPLRDGKRKMTETLVGVTKAQAESILADRKKVVDRGEFLADAENDGQRVVRSFHDGKVTEVRANNASTLRQLAADPSSTILRKNHTCEAKDGASRLDLCVVVQ